MNMCSTCIQRMRVLTLVCAIMSQSHFSRSLSIVELSRPETARVKLSLLLLCGLIRSVLGDVDTGIVAAAGISCFASLKWSTEVAADFCGKEGGQKCKAHPATLSRARAPGQILREFTSIRRLGKIEVEKASNVSQICRL